MRARSLLAGSLAALVVGSAIAAPPAQPGPQGEEPVAGEGSVAGGPTFVCPHCPSVNNDGMVNVVDLVEVILEWGCSGQCSADVNGDLQVNVQDLVKIILNWGPCVPPNDDCSDVQDIVLDQFGDCTFLHTAQEEFCTIGATTDGPAHTACNFSGYNQVGSDVWFRVTAVHTGPLTVSTCQGQSGNNANYNTKIAIYGLNPSDSCTCPGSPSPPVLLGCNDDTPGVGNCSRLQVSVEAGKCYRIRVGGFQGAQGAGVLDLDNRPWGETCTYPFALAQSTFVTVTGSTADAAVACDNTDDTLCALNDTIDEWYYYVPFCDATVTVSTCAPGTNFDTTLAVFAAPGPPPGCYTNLPSHQVACNDDFSNPACQLPNGSSFKSQLSFLATSGGTAYLIRISGYNGATGNYQMTVLTDCIGGQ